MNAEGFNSVFPQLLAMLIVVGVFGLAVAALFAGLDIKDPTVASLVTLVLNNAFQLGFVAAERYYKRKAE